MLKSIARVAKQSGLNKDWTLLQSERYYIPKPLLKLCSGTEIIFSIYSSITASQGRATLFEGEQMPCFFAKKNVSVPMKVQVAMLFVDCFFSTYWYVHVFVE